MRETEHLHQVRHRAFAAVVLPVRISDETHGRVQRQIGRHGRLSGRVERQQVLHAHQCVQNRKTADVKQQHCDGIGQPMLLTVLLHTAGPIDRRFHRPQNRRQKRAFAAENARHVGTEHRRDGDNNRAVERNLNPAEKGHGANSLRTALA